MSSDELRLKAQTVLNQKLVEQGEKDRLKDLLRSRLIECGWRDRMKLLCREKIQKVGVDSVTVDSLVADITKEARSSIPDSVKRELLDKIKAFLIEQTNPQ